MPDEEMIDKIVKDAANQHHPPYDDTAWEKMEVLLDKHLPQKKDRRRPFIFLLFFLLLGGALFFTLENWNKKNTATAVASADEKNSGTLPPTSNTANTTKGTTDGTNAMPTDNTGIANADNSLIGQQQNETATTSGKLPAQGVTDGKNNGQKNMPQVNTADAGNDPQYAGSRKNGYDQKSSTKIKIKNPGVADGDDALQKQKNAVVKNDTDEKTESPVTTKADKIVIESANNNSVNKTADKKDVAITKTDSAATTKAETKKDTTLNKNKTAASTNKQNKKRFTDKIAVTLSAGADVSYVDIDNAGKAKLAYGAGLRYALGKHLTVASGLYVTNKVYTAAPYQYKFAIGYPPQNLKEIGANCKVYEIPVSVYYSTRQVKNHNWLGGVGLSSLLMKKEAYDYRYQTPSGQNYSYSWAISNKNKHYFSVLTLSGGYQYTLNNNLSFIAEPYVKIPLSGIGEGKLKLGSAGVLVTAAIKPFAKKKKK